MKVVYYLLELVGSLGLPVIVIEAHIPYDPTINNLQCIISHLFYTIQLCLMPYNTYKYLY